MPQIAFTNEGSAWNAAGTGMNFSVTRFKLWSAAPATLNSDTEDSDLGSQRYPTTSGEFASITSTVEVVADLQYEFRIVLDTSVPSSGTLTFRSIGLYLDASDTLFAVIVLDEDFVKTTSNTFKLNIPIQFGDTNSDIEVSQIEDPVPAKIVEVADLEGLGQASNAGAGRTVEPSASVYEFNIGTLPADGEVAATLPFRPSSITSIHGGTTGTIELIEGTGTGKGLVIVGSQVKVATSGTRYLTGGSTAVANNSKIRISHTYTAKNAQNTYLVQDLNILAHVSVDSDGDQWEFDGYHYVGDVEIESTIADTNNSALTGGIDVSKFINFAPLNFGNNYRSGDLIVQTKEDSAGAGGNLVVGLAKRISAVESHIFTHPAFDLKANASEFGNGETASANANAGDISRANPSIVSITETPSGQTAITLEEQSPDTNAHGLWLGPNNDILFENGSGEPRWLRPNGVAVAAGSSITVKYTADDVELSFERSDGPTHNMADGDTLALYARNKYAKKVSHRVEIDEFELDDRYITPKDLGQSAVSVRAWATFRGTDTALIYDDYNVSSLTDLGTGQYQLRWENTFSNTVYARHATVGNLSDTSTDFTQNIFMHLNTGNQSLYRTRFHTVDHITNAREDAPFISFLAVGSDHNTGFGTGTIVQPIEPIVSEGDNVTLQVRLGESLSGNNAIITPGTPTPNLITTSPSSLTFTSSDWDDWQDITITGSENNDFGDSTIIEVNLPLTRSGNGSGTKNITVLLRPANN